MSIPNDPARHSRRPNIRDAEESAPVRTLRPGDMLYIDSANTWELVVSATEAEASDPPAWEIRTATVRDATAWVLPADQDVRVLRGDMRHPSWCSPRHCGALNPAAPYHWSPPATVQAHALTGWKITASVWKSAEEPIDEGQAALFLAFEEMIPVLGSRFVLDLTDVEAVQFHTALGPLVAVLAHQAAARGQQ